MTNEQLLPIIHKVMDKLMNLGGADYDSDKNTSKEQSDQGLIARDFGIEEWDWPQGVGLYGLYTVSYTHLMTSEEQDHLASWLYQANSAIVPDNNWHFFVVLANLALKKLGKPYSQERIQQGIDRYESFYFCLLYTSRCV